MVTFSTWLLLLTGTSGSGEVLAGPSIITVTHCAQGVRGQPRAQLLRALFYSEPRKLRRALQGHQRWAGGGKRLSGRIAHILTLLQPGLRAMPAPSEFLYSFSHLSLCLSIYPPTHPMHPLTYSASWLFRSPSRNGVSSLCARHCSRR